MDFLRGIEPYQRITPTPRAFLIFAPLPASKEAAGGVGAAGSLGFVGRLLALSFRVRPRLLSEAKGWRLSVIADASAPFARPGGRELQEREKGTGPWAMSPETEEKDRPIDPMSGIEFVRERARSGVEPNGQADGRQPFMPQECLTTPAF